MMLIFEPTSMRMEFPPSSRNVLLCCLLCTVSEVSAVPSGGFPRQSVALPGGLPRTTLACGLPSAMRTRSMHWKYDACWT
eukprot:9474870-Pyramimonas_sp.AAC.1